MRMEVAAGNISIATSRRLLMGRRLALLVTTHASVSSNHAGMRTGPHFHLEGLTII